MSGNPKPRPHRVLVSRFAAEGPWMVALGPHSPFVADPSQAPALTLADRYTATATGVTTAIQVTVTDRETGATARQAGGEDVILTVPSAMPEDDAARLLRDARAIVGIARRQTGGPAVGTGRRPSEIIAAIVALWHPDPPPDGTPPTQAEVADRAGTDSAGRTIRRIGQLLPGPGKPWERLLRDASIARQMNSVRLASSRSDQSSSEDTGHGRTDEPTQLVAGNADPSAGELGRPPITRRR